MRVHVRSSRPQVLAQLEVREPNRFASLRSPVVIGCNAGLIGFSFGGCLVGRGTEGYHHCLVDECGFLFRRLEVRRHLALVEVPSLCVRAQWRKFLIRPDECFVRCVAVRFYGLRFFGGCFELDTEA